MHSGCVCKPQFQALDFRAKGSSNNYNCQNTLSVISNKVINQKLQVIQFLKIVFYYFKFLNVSGCRKLGENLYDSLQQLANKLAFLQSIINRLPLFEKLQFVFVIPIFSLQYFNIIENMNQMSSQKREVTSLGQSLDAKNAKS